MTTGTALVLIELQRAPPRRCALTTAFHPPLVADLLHVYTTTDDIMVCSGSKNIVLLLVEGVRAFSFTLVGN